MQLKDVGGYGVGACVIASVKGQWLGRVDVKYLRKEPSSYPARLALDLLLLLLLLVASAISIQTREIAMRAENSLRRAIEVVKGRGAIGMMGLAAARRPTARSERRRSIVAVVKGERLMVVMSEL